MTTSHTGFTHVKSMTPFLDIKGLHSESKENEPEWLSGKVHDIDVQDLHSCWVKFL